MTSDTDEINDKAENKTETSESIGERNAEDNSLDIRRDGEHVENKEERMGGENVGKEQNCCGTLVNIEQTDENELVDVIVPSDEDVRLENGDGQVDGVEDVANEDEMSSGFGNIDEPFDRDGDIDDEEESNGGWMKSDEVEEDESVDESEDIDADKCVENCELKESGKDNDMADESRTDSEREGTDSEREGKSVDIVEEVVEKVQSGESNSSDSLAPNGEDTTSIGVRKRKRDDENEENDADTGVYVCKLNESGTDSEREGKSVDIVEEVVEKVQFTLSGESNSSDSLAPIAEDTTSVGVRKRKRDDESEEIDADTGVYVCELNESGTDSEREGKSVEIVGEIVQEVVEEEQFTQSDDEEFEREINSSDSLTSIGADIKSKEVRKRKGDDENEEIDAETGGDVGELNESGTDSEREDELEETIVRLSDDEDFESDSNSSDNLLLVGGDRTSKGVANRKGSSKRRRVSTKVKESYFYGNMNCTLCGKSVSRRRCVLSGHMQSIHKLSGRNLKRTLDLMMNDVRKGAEKRYSCLFCNRSYGKKNLTEYHLLTGSRSACEYMSLSDTFLDDIGESRPKNLEGRVVLAKKLFTMCEQKNKVKGTPDPVVWNPRELTKKSKLTVGVIVREYQNSVKCVMKPSEMTKNGKGKGKRQGEMTVTRKSYLVERILRVIFPKANTIFTLEKLVMALFRELDSEEKVDEFCKRLNYVPGGEDDKGPYVGMTYIKSVYEEGRNLLRFFIRHCCADVAYIPILENAEKELELRCKNLRENITINQKLARCTNSKSNVVDMDSISGLLDDKCRFESLVRTCQNVVREKKRVGQKRSANYISKRRYKMLIAEFQEMLSLILPCKTGKRCGVILSMQHGDVVNAKRIIENDTPLRKMIIVPNGDRDYFKKCVGVIKSEIAVTVPVHDLLILLVQLKELSTGCTRDRLVFDRHTRKAFENTSVMIRNAFDRTKTKKPRNLTNANIRKTLSTLCRRVWRLTLEEEELLARYLDHKHETHKEHYLIESEDLKDYGSWSGRIVPPILLDYIVPLRLPGESRRFDCLEDLRKHLGMVEQECA